MADLEFGILGTLEVRRNGKQVHITAPKQLTLLALLLLHRNQVVPVERLIDEIWESRPPETARNILHSLVLRLRRLLASPERDHDEIKLMTRPPGYILLLEANQLDLCRFEELATLGRHALKRGEYGKAAGLMRDALALWRGPPLADVCATPLLTAVTVRLNESRLLVLEERIDADLKRGEFETVMGELLELVAEYPLREQFWHHLMLAAYWSGRRGEALDAYRQARTRFVEELGLEPATQLRELQAAILRDDPSLLPPVSPRGPFFASPPRQLPPDIVDLTGRDEHVKSLFSLLTRDNADRAAVDSIVVGMGGIGKTALAVRVAHRVSEHFPDGQLYADLHGIGLHPALPQDVLSQFLRALGVDRTDISDDLDERAAMFRSQIARSRVLMILDNARDEAQVMPLLPGNTRCGVLVTSRNRLLGLECSQRIELDVLAEGHAIDLLARIAGRGRIAAEPEAARELAGRCGGLPLALRIAGARLASRPDWRLCQFAARFADEHRRLDQLAHDNLGVRASFAASYARLDPVAQRLFRLLGLIEAPDFPSRAGAALLNVDVADAEEILDRLVDAHLLGVGGRDRGGQTRYRFHDLIRVYAREQAQTKDVGLESHTALAPSSVSGPPSPGKPIAPPTTS
jgi:DNA-binding SARP family transcriptional activator